MSSPRLAAVLLGLLLSGCYEGADPLDPAVLAEIARSRGDAQGLARSGLYVGDLEPMECGCDEYEAAQELSLCYLADLVGMFGQSNYFPLMLNQADGTVQIQIAPQNQVVGGSSSVRGVTSS
ncbi:MAG: hypothetical protein KDK70_34565 [Myxococcales bacterium]|nr:hypothetical protein [Myxococcales bacterium]